MISIKLTDKTNKNDLQKWHEFRKLLWGKDHTDEDLLEEMNELKEEKDCDVLFAINPSNKQVIGFAELGIRSNVPGCKTNRVGYLEGIYVLEDYRRQKVASKLINEAENWAREKGCKEFGSDCELDNKVSEKMHLNSGFILAEKLIYFRKNL